MKKLSTKGMKALKVIHLVCAIAWFGSAITMNLLRHLIVVKETAYKQDVNKAKCIR